MCSCAFEPRWPLILFFVTSVTLAEPALQYRVRQDDPQMTPQQLRRLAEKAVREARTLAATEGYFSARAQVSIEEDPWVVRLALEPGERSRIGEVDLRFSGAALDDPKAAEIFSRVRDAWPLRRGRMVVASAEYMQWIGEGWGVAGFVDAGDAWDDNELFGLALGYGVRARFRTPIGPIRADLAYGEESGELRLHFSVGFTF